MMDFSNNVLMEGTIGADLVRYNNALVYLSIKGTPICVHMRHCVYGGV